MNFSARRQRLYISSASNESLGAFLSQKNWDGNEQARYYLSRALQGQEKNYSPIKWGTYKIHKQTCESCLWALLAEKSFDSFAFPFFLLQDLVQLLDWKERNELYHSCKPFFLNFTTGEELERLEKELLQETYGKMAVSPRSLNIGNRTARLRPVNVTQT